MECKIRYLEMIQNIISRISSNSFLLKGWTVTIVVGLLAFANLKQMEPKFIVLALVPTIIFWVLDSFFLLQERLYRRLYNHAITLKEDEIDFSLNAYKFKDEVANWFKIMFTKTILLFYIPILIVILLALFSSKWL